MSRFIIENILIEKSDKDIQTGVSYKFTEGINLVCGNNEAGKSSLMKFIQEGFFRPMKTDTGKIFFSVCEGNEKLSYRADIKNAQKKDKRCILYDNNNSVCDYSLLEKLINQKYFEEGFTINLDDLMNIQYDNNMTLVNVIKDPSGDKLNSFLQKINENISEYVGVNGKPKKTITDITSQIAQINLKIKELSQKESQYNNTILFLNEIEEDIQRLAAEEEYINLIIALKESESELETFIDKNKKLNVEFNNKLFNAKEKYVELIQNAGKYDSNNGIIQRYYQKLETVNNKLALNLNRLNSDYAINSNEENLLQFVIDYDKISRVKGLLAETDNAKSEIKAYEKTIEDIEQTILKLKNDFEYLNKENENKYDKSELEELYKILDNGLKQYKYLASEISNINQKIKINAEGIFTNRNSLLIFGALFILTSACSMVSFYQKIQSAGIFCLFLSIIIAIGCIIQKLGSYQGCQTNDKVRKQTQQEAILETLISKLRKYYPEIENVESSYLPVKIEELKQEIYNTLINLNSLNAKLEQNEKDIKFNESKRQNINEKILNLNTIIDAKLKEIETLVNSDNSGIIIPIYEYISVVELIKNIKNDISEKNSLNKEIEEIKVENDEIYSAFNNFIIEHDININLSSDINENINNLKILNEKNYDLKQQIDILNLSIETLTEKIQKIKESQIPYEKEFSVINLPNGLNERLEEISLLRKEKLNQKKEAEFKKRELEDFEGIINLKNEKNVLENKYRNIIKKLFVNKGIMAVTSMAKTNFDKTQPDLVNAQKYLALLTEGKYTKINLETEEIISEDETLIKKWEELSRGTKEQLYLALRLGYASNYSKDKNTLEYNGRANLPLVIDDAFVNFDYDRTKNALKCLIEFSGENQVIFFTCHTDSVKQQLSELGLNENQNLNIIYIN